MGLKKNKSTVRKKRGDPGINWRRFGWWWWSLTLPHSLTTDRKKKKRRRKNWYQKVIERERERPTKQTDRMQMEEEGKKRKSGCDVFEKKIRGKYLWAVIFWLEKICNIIGLL